MNMLEQADSIIKKKSKKCKELQKKLSALEQSFDDLNATHERLVEAHEKLGKAHTLFLEQDKKRVIVSCDVGVTCDIIDESFYEPIVIAPTNPSCSTSSTTTITPISTLVMVSLVMPH
jgi:hypothetical protein